jgi:PD-(D/E)XK nuclease superfamily
MTIGIGVFIESEPHLSNGRADVVVQTPQFVYIFEFKFNKNAEEALQQIKDKGYADKYHASEKTIIGIGVNFFKTKKKITGWLTEKL